MSLDDARNCGMRVTLVYHRSVNVGFMEIGKFSSFDILRSLVAFDHIICCGCGINGIKFQRAGLYCVLTILTHLICLAQRNSNTILPDFGKPLVIRHCDSFQPLFSDN
mmetsp:Transcript_12332/g.26010  ORF Transcript_12332/g.26010 Transcript_12332/m.26010 type:complete len:108 (-) Transcript_12332:85-408(-)